MPKPQVTPSCFISYALETATHKEWVRSLGEELQRSGVHVALDQWDLKLGDDLLHFMESGVRESDFVLLICTPMFAQKANSGLGGVGYEKSIVTGEIFHSVGTPAKFVPVLRAGEPKTSLPSYLLSRVFIDFRKDSDFADRLEHLVRHIFDDPLVARPSLGTKPSFSPRSPMSEASQVRFCKYCGATPGSPTKCEGPYANHTFVAGSQNSFCKYCGATPGSPSKCAGPYANHTFVAGSQNSFCKYCGATPGSPSKCAGPYANHTFIE